jgi:hypothetical protein
MGAEQFINTYKGASAAEAFDACVKQALYDHGHSGYSGTIAEKSSFIMLGVAPSMSEAVERTREIMRRSGSPVDDKWGPAGCIRVEGTDEFVFFGWASS